MEARNEQYGPNSDYEMAYVRHTFLIKSCYKPGSYLMPFNNKEQVQYVMKIQMGVKQGPYRCLGIIPQRAVTDFHRYGREVKTSMCAKNIQNRDLWCEVLLNDNKEGGVITQDINNSKSLSRTAPIEESIVKSFKKIEFPVHYKL